MNGWFKRIAIATATLTAGAALAGCGVGQVSQVATQEPAINGVAGSTGQIQLRNVHLRGEQTTDAIQPGDEVELLLFATNMSPDSEDTLVGITSDVGEVEITGDRTVPPSQSLIIGQPDGVPQGIEALEGATQAEAVVTLTQPITNGVTYDFEFEFQNSGTATVSVPIDAGLQPRREEGGSEEHSSGEGH